MFVSISSKFEVSVGVPPFPKIILLESLEDQVNLDVESLSNPRYLKSDLSLAISPVKSPEFEIIMLLSIVLFMTVISPATEFN